MINVVLVVSSIETLKKSDSRVPSVTEFISSRKSFFASLPSELDTSFSSFAFDNRKPIGSIARAISHFFESRRSLASIGISSDRVEFLSSLCGPSDDSFSKLVSRFDRLAFEYTRAKLVGDFVNEVKTRDQLLEIAKKLKITIIDPEKFGSNGVRFTNCRDEKVEFGDVSLERETLESKFKQISLRLLHIEGILLSDDLFDL